MTTMVVIFGLGVGGGLPGLAIAAVGLSMFQPGVVVASALVYTALHRIAGHSPHDETILLAAIAGELRAGRSLRQALAGPGTTMADHPLQPAARLAAIGVPFSELEPLIRQGLPESASLVVPAMSMLEETGGNAAAVFELLTESIALQRSIEDEQRAALAPARVSAGILGALAASALGWLVASGRMASLLSDPTGQWLAALGLAFIGAGTVGFVAMVRGGVAP